MSERPVKLIGVIQCDFAKERCSGFGCVNSFAQRMDGFKGYPEGVMLVPFNCGGCPGRRISRIVSNLVSRAKKKANIEKDEIVIRLATCMVTDNGHYPPCPHIAYIEQILERKGLRVKKGSYKSKTAQSRRDSGVYEQFNWEEE